MEIRARQGKNFVTVIVDDEEKWIREYSWSLNGSGYVYCWRGALHRMLMKATGSIHVDHINRNRLDNRKQNLRLVPKYVNQRNTSRAVAQSSGTRGVTWKADCKGWQAYLSFKGRYIHLGVYKELEHAKTARLFGEVLYYGESV